MLAGRTIALVALPFSLASCKSPARQLGSSSPSSATRSPSSVAREPAPATSVAPGALPEVELVQTSGPVHLDDKATRALVERVEKGLAVCNFTSETRAEIFGEDPAELWKKREQGPHLRLRYRNPRTIDAIAGKLVMSEAMLSIGQTHGPEPALMKGEHGVVGLKKCGYDDRFLGCVPELAAHFPKPAACPPGM